MIYYINEFKDYWIKYVSIEVQNLIKAVKVVKPKLSLVNRWSQPLGYMENML
ncbi:hypothetical protein GCM10007112_22880 [Vulcanisaeta souniana JCM 11219]|uniref:Uncharacterized protein n=1 Tax=Vulcanisaeta souniana JCM 11219 TaxID=1293586 RepID=A0A830E9W4_9CREN|nr:hypothetical protein GCM10007112_22880 [Vulcanisaeta souniana JCM 11219]